MSTRRTVTESPGGQAARWGAGDPTARVTSADGTQIAYWSSGTGPPIVVVHGAIADHTRWRPILPHLEEHITVHAVDRRGRGGSGDHPDYALEREAEDVAAVVDDVAAAAGTSVDLYGHSFGGICAYGAASLTDRIRRLVLYEGWPVADPNRFAMPPDIEERLDALLAQGDREAVVVTVLRELVHMAGDELAAMRAQPSWPARVAAAHTVSRELRAMRDAYLDRDRAAGVTVPTLLLVGSESRDSSAGDVEALAASLPDARVEVVDGQGHVADVMAPADFARRLRRFVHRVGGN